MTRKEVTEIFSVMMLAWPGAEVFKGGLQKLGPTIQLWTSCLEDVDYWTAQQAVVRLCKECRFPPTIADFRDKVDAVNSDINGRINRAIQDIRSGEYLHKTIEGYYAQLPATSMTRAVIDEMGGPANLTIKGKWDGREMSMWNWEGFKQTYRMMLRKENALGDKARPALGAGTKEK